jgi:AcrR family transcriptional regulator
MPKRRAADDDEAAAGGRRSQADRSATTRAALEAATIELLIEHGWSAVSAIEVCNRAGVSRGAFHHHYPSLSSLLADALRRLYAEMRTMNLPPPTDLTGLIDYTWAAVDNPRFKAVLEAWLAMANDPSLRADLGPVVAEFSKLMSPEEMAPSILANDQDIAIYLMARETMIGLALGRATNRGRPLGHEQAVLAQLRRTVTTRGS